MKFTLFFLFLLLSLNCHKDEKKLFKSEDYKVFHEQALDFCTAKNYNLDYYFLIDLKIPSGKNRFFVYDFNSKTNLYEKLTTHGTCDVFSENESKWTTALISNRLDSHCSATGKYKIGKRDYSGWGIGVKYWMIGLEDSNYNSEKRITVLHSWGAVKNYEVHPQYSPLSWGCPAVSNEFMKILDEKLSATKKPVLMWIIN